MASQCSVCGTKLFGDEVLEGVCEACKAAGGAASTDVQTGRPSSSATYLPLRGGREDGPGLPRPPVQGGPEWATFRLGLLLLCAYQVVGIVVAGLALALLLVDPKLYHSLQLPVLVPAFAVMGLVGLAGVALLCTVPSWTGRRTLAWISLACLPVLIPSIALIQIYAESSQSSADRPGELPSASVLLPVLGGECGALVSGVTFLICFTWLLAGVAHSLGDRGLRNGLIAYPITVVSATILFTIVLFVITFMQIMGSGGPLRPDQVAARTEAIKPTIELIGGVFGLVSGVAFGRWFIYLLLRLRSRLA
jgi:hypothetical protein